MRSWSVSLCWPVRSGSALVSASRTSAPGSPSPASADVGSVIRSSDLAASPAISASSRNRAASRKLLNVRIDSSARSTMRRSPTVDDNARAFRYWRIFWSAGKEEADAWRTNAANAWLRYVASPDATIANRSIGGLGARPPRERPERRRLSILGRRCELPGHGGERLGAADLRQHVDDAFRMRRDLKRLDQGPRPCRPWRARLDRRHDGFLHRAAPRRRPPRRAA